MTQDLVSPIGEVGRFDEANVEAALAAGFRPATKQEVAEVEYGGAKAAAAAAVGGAARGATIGLSDVAIRALAPGAADYLAKATEAQPGFAIGGEIAGTAAGMLYGGGEAGLAAKAVSLPTRLVTRAGEAAGAVAGRLTDRAIISGAVRAGTEGAIYGAGTALSEAALGDDYNHIAESLVANAGLGAVAGAGISSVLEGAVTRFPKTPLGKAAETYTTEKNTIREKLGSAIEDVINRGVKTTEEAKLAGELKRGIKTPVDADVRARVLAKDFDELLTIDRELRMKMFGDAKIKQVGDLIDHENWSEALQVTSQAYGEAAQVQALLESAADKGGAGVAVKKMSTQLEMLGKTIDTIGDVAEDQRALKLFTALDKFKRETGKAAEFGKRFPSTEAAKEYNALYHGTDQMTGLRRALEHNAWGRAADAQREINEVVSNKLTLQREFDRHWTTQHGSEAGYSVDRLDPGTYKSLLTDITGAQHDLKWESMNNVLYGLANQADMGLKHYAWSGAEIEKLNAVRGKVDALLKQVDSDKLYSKQLQALEAARADESQTGLLATMVRSIPFAGPALGEAAEFLTSPIQRAEVFAMIKGRVKSAEERVTAGLEKQLAGKLDAPKQLKTKPITPEDIDRFVKPVAGHAPNVGASMTSVATRAMLFLESKRPKARPDNSTNDKEHVTKAEAAKYNRYAEATIDPVKTLSRPLTKEHVEAYEAVYPTWLQNVRGIAQEKMFSSKKPVSSGARQRLGVLLGRPADWSVEPVFVANVQAAWTKPAETQASGPAARPIKLKTYATQSERIEAT